MCGAFKLLALNAGGTVQAHSTAYVESADRYELM